MSTLAMGQSDCGSLWFKSEADVCAHQSGGNGGSNGYQALDEAVE